MKLNKTKLNNIQKTMRKHTVLGMTALALASSGVGVIATQVVPGSLLGNLLAIKPNTAHADTKTIDTGHNGIQAVVNQLTGTVRFTNLQSADDVDWVKSRVITNINATTGATLWNGQTISVNHTSGNAYIGALVGGSTDPSVFTAGSGKPGDLSSDDTFSFGDGGFYLIPTWVGDMDTPTGITSGPIAQHAVISTANGNNDFGPVNGPDGSQDGNTGSKDATVYWYDWSQTVSIHAYVAANPDIGTNITIFGYRPDKAPQITFDQPKPPVPTKTVSNGGKDINGGTTTPNQEWDFSVNQTLPSAVQDGAHYDSMHFEDNVPATAKIISSGVKVVDEAGNDVTGNFDINVSGQKVTADAHSDWMSGGSNLGHTYSLKIPTMVNIDDQTKTAADLKTDNVATSTVNDKSQTSNHVVVSPKFNTPAVKKSVSVDAGKSWVTDANLKGHDSDYTYKVDYTLSDHVEYATLQLRDYVEDLQSVGGVKIVDAAGNDITGDFTITGLPAAGANTDGKKTQATITATAKDPSKYRRVGGQISMILSGVTLKGDGAQDDMNYYDSSDKLIHIPNIADMYWKDTTPDPKEPDTLKSNTTRVTPPNPVNPENPKDPKTPVVTKQVSVDGGKTWTDPTKETPAQLSTHDQTYTWMTNFNITNYFNFDGAGSLTLTDHFENLQKYDNVKIMQGADAQGQGGIDITDKFNISEKDTSATGKDIIAAVKAENANDFDDIGGTKDASLANVKMIVNGTTVKGATGTQELNYLTKDGNVDIPNISTLTEDDKVATDYYARSKDSNKAWVRLPRVNPMIDKYVEDDGDSALVNAKESDVLNNEAASSSSSSSSSSSAKSDSSAKSSSTETNTTDSSSSSSSSTSSSSSSSSNDDTLTINDAIDGANKVLTRLDNMAVPYPDSVEKASDNLVNVAADRTSTASDIKKAADALNDAIDAAIKDGSLKTASK